MIMRRASPRLIALRAVDAVKVYLPFMLLQGGVAERLPQWLQLPWTVLVVYYSATRLQVLLFDWLTTRYAISEEGITLQTGWPTREVAQARWSQISALSFDQDLAHRLCRRTRARAVIGAEGREDLLLEALGAADIELLRALHARTRPSGVGASRATTGPEVPAQDDLAGRLVYRATLRDKALISLTHGKFLLIVPFVLGAYSDLAGMIGLPDGTWLIDRSLNGGLGILGIAVASAFGFGFLRATVQFHDFHVMRERGRFVASGGLLHHEAREARTDAVCGVRLSQNPLMRLVGCSQLTLVLRNTRGDFRSFVVLPVAPTRQAEQLASEMLPQLQEGTGGSRSPRWVPVAALSAALGAAAVTLALSLPWVAASALVTGFVVADLGWSQLTLTQASASVSHRRGILFVRRYMIKVSGVRTVKSWRRARSARSCLSRVTIMDRRPVGLWTVTPTTLVVDDLSREVLLAEEGVLS